MQENLLEFHMMFEDDSHQCDSYPFIWNNVRPTVPQIDSSYVVASTTLPVTWDRPFLMPK